MYKQTHINNEQTLDLTIYNSFSKHRGLNPVILEDGTLEIHTIDDNNPTTLFTMDINGMIQIVMRDGDPITTVYPNVLVNGIALLTQIATTHPVYFNQPDSSNDEQLLRKD